MRYAMALTAILVGTYGLARQAAESPRPVSAIFRIVLIGSGATAAEIFGGIQKGKYNSRGCIEIVGRDQADAILETSESTGPATWTGEGTAVTQSAVLKSLDGNILWTGMKRNLLERPLLKQLTAALQCKARRRK